MTRRDVEELIRRQREAIERHDPVATAIEHAADGIFDSATAGGIVRGRAAIEQVYRTWFTAFPDMTLTTEELLIDGDRAVQIATVAGTDTGGFMGMSPSGRPFRIPVVLVCTVREGVIVHQRNITDFTGLLVQIGVLKAKPA